MSVTVDGSTLMEKWDEAQQLFEQIEGMSANDPRFKDTLQRALRWKILSFLLFVNAGWDHSARCCLVFPPAAPLSLPSPTEFLPRPPFCFILNIMKLCALVYFICRAFQTCAVLVSEKSLFSENEELEEIATSSLKYVIPLGLPTSIFHSVHYAYDESNIR